MNWYLVKEGKIISRFPELPSGHIMEDGSAVSGLSALSQDELGKFGFFPGEEQPMPEFDAETHRAFIEPAAEGKVVKENWVIVELTQVEINRLRRDALMGLRIKRNLLLRDSDFVLLEDAPYTAEQKLAVKSYRQELRDLPTKIVRISDPVVWPTPPAFMTGGEFKEKTDGSQATQGAQAGSR